MSPNHHRPDSRRWEGREFGPGAEFEAWIDLGRGGRCASCGAEWHATHDPETGRIRLVAFTSEPPEFWQALFGVVPGDGNAIPDMTFPGDKELLLRRYRDWVSPDIQFEDLVASEDIKDATRFTWIQKGQYNFYNKWNTTHGIVHLCSPPNSLVAEVQLGGDGTVLHNDPKGRLLVEPDALIAFAAYGGPNRKRTI